MKCARCERPIVGHPAISRVDNKTEICSECGPLEALEAMSGMKSELKNV